MFKNKEEIRNYVWKRLKECKVGLFPLFGRIPNFIDVEKSIRKLFEIKEFLKAKRIFISPDTPQRKLLSFVDLNEKEVYMATPKLRYGYVKLTKPFNTLKELLKNSIRIEKLPRIDFALIGSVAVDLKGNRIGKGGGFGDIEIKTLRKINKNVTIATNVHDIQIFDDISYLMEPHDEKVNIIVTPTKIIRCNI